MAENACTQFSSWMLRHMELQVRPLPQARSEEYRELVRRCESFLEEASFPWSCLPATIQEIFGPRGWAWNGIYVDREDRLELFAAAGPPVCHTLEKGEGTGMCADGLRMNQTLVAADVKSWPGYVSCDGESGLATRSGIVCPIRTGRGEPLAVWDLDCVQELEPEDPPFFDRLFATLSALVEPSAPDFAERQETRSPEAAAG